jgi:hypothetical protein
MAISEFISLIASLVGAFAAITGCTVIIWHVTRSSRQRRHLHRQARSLLATQGFQAGDPRWAALHPTTEPSPNHTGGAR